MNADILKSISTQVFRRFPELEGTKPKVQPQSTPKSLSEQMNYLIIYKGVVKTTEGKSVQRIVRIVATSKGKILKMTTSR